MRGWSTTRCDWRRAGVVRGPRRCVIPVDTDPISVSAEIAVSSGRAGRPAPGADKSPAGAIHLSNATDLCHVNTVLGTEDMQHAS